MTTNRKDSRTTAQIFQRFLMKVAALCYTMVKTICNHSFEGVSTGFKPMNKFKKVNLPYDFVEMGGF